MPTVKQHVERIQRANRAAFLARHNPLTWTPRDGETVHLRRGNPFGAPAGRYTLRRWFGEPGDVIVGEPGDVIVGEPYDLVGGGDCGATYRDELVAMEASGVLTPISQSELAREIEEVRLRLRAPLRGNRLGAMRAQHDASALPLFTAANETALF